MPKFSVKFDLCFLSATFGGPGALKFEFGGRNIT